MDDLVLAPSRVSRSAGQRSEVVEDTPRVAVGAFLGLGTGVVIGSLMWLLGILICRSLF